MSFELQGKLERIYDTHSVTDRFKKREFVVMIQDGMYPEYIKLQLTQDRCELLDDCGEGDEVKVFFNLKGRPYDKGGETIYFTNLDAWKIEKSGQAASAETGAVQDNPSTNDGGDDAAGLTFTEAGDDELPF
ncbi:DUF3127 domain-containing protein [Rapidithrix thailandica]|uniref:DUF3127 domain-containing protein n=1 Tax=Rapidithrix thailandica TaxID=413964 RepID=A0AAW9SE40_9BACT